ncbi:MAG: hypothetical protein HGGPFJEG_02993 [Ignavibacteria bacterium]|nr:hypothetical protein [Ignavibacteria bacterium]
MTFLKLNKNNIAVHYKICFISILLSYLVTGCNFFNDNKEQYFKKSKASLENLLNLINKKDKISFIDRRTYFGIIYKILKEEEIKYKIENYETELEISFELKRNFNDEINEIRKIIFGNKVKSILNINNELITLDSALTDINLSKEEMISIFQLMKQSNVTFISRFDYDANSIYFRIDDKYFIIYSENILKLNLERKKEHKTLGENWYYYDGVL